MGTKRLVALNRITMAVDGYLHSGRTATQTVEAIREATTDPQLLATVAAGWASRPEVVALFLRAGADPATVDANTPKRPAGSGFNLGAMADRIQHR